MKTTLCLVTAMLLTLSHAFAAPNPLAEIIDLILSNQKNSASFEDGERFDLLMQQQGAADAKLSSAEIQKLNPAHLEDRIRLIALHRFQHRPLFDGIYHTYVRHPTEAEIEKLRKEYLALHPNGTTRNADTKKPLRMVDNTILAPEEVEPLHLTAPYRYCFEYYLLAPRHEPCLRHYDATLTTALDHLKRHLKEIDVRILVEARLYSELEAHLQSLKLVGGTLDDLKDHLGPAAFETADTLGYSFHIGGSLHAYYLCQLQGGKVTAFKRIPESDWRTRSDHSTGIGTFFPPMKKP